MPIVKNVATLISDASEHKTIRTVIFQDHITPGSVYAEFTHPYDDLVNEDAVKQLFGNSVQRLKNERATIYEASDLQIVKFIGLFKVTLVTRLSNGDVIIRDGTRTPMSNYLGVGD